MLKLAATYWSVYSRMEQVKFFKGCFLKLLLLLTHMLLGSTQSEQSTGKSNYKYI